MTAIRATVDGGVAVVTLDHPPLNILTRAVLAELRSELASLALNPELRAVILRAEGKHFSAGADVGEHLPPTYETMIPEFLDTVLAVAAFPVPAIAAVQGRCLGGGCEIAAAADFVLAGEGASFGQPEIKLGVLPPAACVLLTERCGPAAAAEIVLTGDAFDAAAAREAGLVYRVVPDGELMAAAGDLAARIARNSAAAVRLGKEALTAPASRLRSEAFSRARDLYVNHLMATHDAVEGLQAFVDKRAPVWSHQ